MIRYLQKRKILFTSFIILSLLSLLKLNRPSEVFAQERVVGRIVNDEIGVHMQPESNTCGTQYETISGAVGNGTLVVKNSSGTNGDWRCNPDPHYQTYAASSGEGPHTFTLIPPAGYDCSTDIRWVMMYQLGYTPPSGAITSGDGCSATVYLGTDDWNNHLWWHLDNSIETPPPPPTNVKCLLLGNTATLSWTAPSGDINDYPLRIVENEKGSSCDPNDPNRWYLCEPEYNGNVTGNSYQFPVTPGNTYRGWIHARSVNGLWSEAVGFTCVSQVPNCKNITGPAKMNLGDTVNYSVEFECPGCAPGEMGGNLRYNNWNLIKSEAFSGTNGTMNASWAPSSAGTYRLWCQAFNDAIAECRPSDLVDGPPRYPCTGPESSITVDVVIPTPTPTPTPECITSSGDTNGDGRAALYDYAVWAYYFNPLKRVTQGPSIGDFNCDGYVNLTDYSNWALHFAPI
ncbi:hypothetical protein JXA63_00350 [Candidatus Woesebacteria bacterium]|nr:hypothetical protein [Candidatus Woesebacteria bacterium]